MPELADGPARYGEVAYGACSFAGNFSVTRSTVLTVAETRHCTDHDASLQKRLALSLPFGNCTGQKPCTALYTI